MGSYRYTYDDAGNVVNCNGHTYAYDSKGQLIRDEYLEAREYTYDDVGNILTSFDGTSTHTYTYGNPDWKDLLTAYDGQTITYDASGNPLSYFNGNRWSFEWSNGRQLVSSSKQSPVVITTQPENYYGASGGTATFTVGAEGERLSYQWQYSADDGKTWVNSSDSGNQTASLRVSIQSSVGGRQYRCVITEAMGHKATSQAGKLVITADSHFVSTQDFEIIDPIAVPNEPDDYYGLIGDTVTFVVEAEGKGLTYQWMRWNEETEQLEPCYEDGYNTPTLRVPLTLDTVGAEFRCFIFDSDGNAAATRSAYVYLDIRDWSYAYNADGLRTERSSDNLTYSYVYSGDKLARMTVDGNDMDFFYDANGMPYALKYMGATYYYITNLHGDVEFIVDGSGLSVAYYEYDAWGNILKEIGSLALLNPLRYRGYVYDQETRLYYLNSRYYDPAVGRFLNADSFASTGQGITGYNMFAYCNNNPFNLRDSGGTNAEALQWWTSTMWWLCGVDTALPIGDVVYGLGILILGGCALYETSKTVSTIVASKSDEDSNALPTVKDYARSISEPDNRYVVHHIVAQGDTRAARAREVLRSVDINPTTHGLNLVVIPEKKHYHLHTTEYYNYINKRFEGLADNKIAVIWTLAELHIEIQLYCQTGVKAW